MENELVTIIGGIIILTVLAGVTYFTFTRMKSDNSIQMANEFLEGLVDELIVIVLNTVKEIDPSNNTTPEEFEVEVLNKIYDKCWDYVELEIKAKAAEDSTLRLIITNIDKDFVIKYIDKVCTKFGVIEKIQGQYVEHQISNCNVEEIDNALDMEYSNNIDYFNKEVEAEDLEPAREPVHTEEEVAALNPQTEEEEEFDTTDESMEIIPNEDEVGKVIAVKDTIGRWCFYKFKDGKKVRISKAEAIPMLKEQGGSEEVLAELSK